MTQTITLTSKRQATFPVRFCKELNVKPGEKILLDRQEVDGKPVWLLHTACAPDAKWFGILKKYAQNKSHDMQSVRDSIGHSRKVA